MKFRTALMTAAAAGAVMLASAAHADTTSTPSAAGGTVANNATLATTVNVPASGTVSSVAIRINSLKTAGNSVGLKLTLSHVDKNGVSKSVVLLDPNNCGNAYNPVYISDTEGTPYSSLPRSACNGAPNAFRPYQPMSAFVGMDMAGDWTLTVANTSGYSGNMTGLIMTVNYNTPQWTTGSWSSYSTTCGSATRTRTVTCTLSGATVADSQCSGTKPDTTESSTQTSGCTYSWKTGAYSPVYPANTTCGATTQTAPVTCQRSDLTTVADSFCTTTKPSGTKPYTDPVQCSYQWTTGQWVEPTTTCGDGTRTRQVTCRSVTDPGFTQSDSMCSATPKPASSEPVSNYTTCGYGWYRSGYSLSACIGGRQTYRAYFSCYRSTGASVNYLCGDKPPNRVISQTCGYWAQTTIGYGDVWGDVVPGGSIGSAQYSTSGMNVGAGYLSKGTTSSGLTGYGNTTGGSGSGGTGTGGVQASGGSYDPDSDVYTDGSGRKFTGGNYNSVTGTYDNATLVSDPNTGTPGTGSGGTGADPADAGRAIVMRRPLPQQ